MSILLLAGEEGRKDLDRYSLAITDGPWKMNGAREMAKERRHSPTLLPH